MAFRNKFSSFGKGGYKFEKDDGKTFSFLIDVNLYNRLINSVFIYNKDLFYNRILFPFSGFGTYENVSKRVYKYLKIDWGDGNITEINNNNVDFSWSWSSSEISYTFQHIYEVPQVYKISIYSEEGIIPPISGGYTPFDAGASDIFYWSQFVVSSIVSILNPVLIQDYEPIDSDGNSNYLKYDSTLRNFKINSIPYNFLQTYNEGTELNSTFQNTVINKVSKYILSFCPNLESIRSIFAGTKLKNIAPDFFSTCTKLKKLSSPFSGTSIENIPDNFLDNNLLLESCSLCSGMSNLKYVPPNLLKPLNNLTSVSSFFSGTTSMQNYPTDFFTDTINNYSSCFRRINMFPPLNIFSNLKPERTYNLQHLFYDIRKKSSSDPDLQATEIWTYFKDFTDFTNTCYLRDNSISSASSSLGDIDLNSFVSYKPFEEPYDFFGNHYGQSYYNQTFSTYFYTFYLKNNLVSGTYTAGIIVYPYYSYPYNKKINFYWIGQDNSENLIISNFDTLLDSGLPYFIKFTANKNIKGFKFTQNGTKDQYFGNYDYYLPDYISIFKWSKDVPNLQNVNECFNLSYAYEYTNFEDIPESYF